MFELKIGNASDKAMSWLEWSSSVISSVAWPIAAIIIAWVFHVPIARLLSKVRKLSYGDAEVDFAERLDEIEDVAQKGAKEEGTVANQPIPLPDERLQKLIAISPSAAILDIWSKLDKRTEEIYNQHELGKFDPTPRSSLVKFTMLRNANLISENTFKVLTEMRLLRNKAAHAYDLTAVDAFRFLSLSELALNALDKT